MNLIWVVKSIFALINNSNRHSCQNSSIAVSSKCMQTVIPNFIGLGFLASQGCRKKFLNSFMSL